LAFAVVLTGRTVGLAFALFPSAASASTTAPPTIGFDVDDSNTRT
jgi:hypothetical protein